MPLLGLERISRADPVYKACVTAATAGGAIIGGATGSILGPAGSVGGYFGGAAWGFSAGYLACPYLAPKIKQKFELGQSLTDQEVSSAARAMSNYAKISAAKDVLKLVSIVRAQSTRKGSAPVCGNPTFGAKRLLMSA